MATTIDELLIKLDVDAGPVKKASEAVGHFGGRVKQAADDAEKGFAQSVGAVNKFELAVDKATKQIAEYEERQKRATQSGVSLWGAVGSAVSSVASGFVSLGKKAVHEAESLFDFVAKGSRARGDVEDLASRTGIAVEEVQRLNFAAKLGGLGPKELAGAYSKLNKSLLDIAGKGGKQAQQGLSLLGLSAQELAPLGAIDRLLLISESLKFVNDESRKGAILQRIFGKSGDRLIPLLENSDQLRKQLGSISVASKDQIHASAELDDAIELLRKRYAGFSGTLLTALTPAFAEVVKAANQWLAVNADFIKQKIHDGVNLFVEAAKAALPIVGKWAVDTGEWVKRNEEWLKQELPNKIAETASALRGMADAFLAVWQVGGQVIEQFKRMIPFLDLVNKKVGEAAISQTAEKLTAESGGPTLLTPITSRPKRTKESDDAKRRRVRLGEQAFATGKVETAKPERAPIVSGITFDQAIAALLSGSPEPGLIQGLASQTPSPKKITPTVAMEIFYFNNVQNIYTSDARLAATRSVEQIQTAIGKGRAHGAGHTLGIFSR